MKKLVIIDGKSVFYRGYYAMNNLSTADGTPTGKENWTLDDYIEKDPTALDALIESDPEAVRKLNSVYSSKK